jgi:hypothetical protein
VQQGGDLLLEIADLGREREREAGLDRDVVGQPGVVDVLGPQGEGLPGRGQQRGGVVLAPGPREYR